MEPIGSCGAVESVPPVILSGPPRILFSGDFCRWRVWTSGLSDFRLRPICPISERARNSFRRKGLIVDPSLSVVLPVHNAEATLATHVAHLLDVLPDLARKFEVLIVDDGSTDHTVESADELARQYPQLRVVRHPARQGMSEVVRTSLAKASGELVYVQNPGRTINNGDLSQIRAMKSQTQSSAKSAGPATANRKKLMIWGN